MKKKFQIFNTRITQLSENKFRHDRVINNLKKLSVSRIEKLTLDTNSRIQKLILQMPNQKETKKLKDEDGMNKYSVKVEIKNFVILATLLIIVSSLLFLFANWLSLPALTVRIVLFFYSEFLWDFY